MPPLATLTKKDMAMSIWSLTRWVIECTIYIGSHPVSWMSVIFFYIIFDIFLSQLKNLDNKIKQVPESKFIAIWCKYSIFDSTKDRIGHDIIFNLKEKKKSRQKDEQITKQKDKKIEFFLA